MTGFLHCSAIEQDSMNWCDFEVEEPKAWADIADEAQDSDDAVDMAIENIEIYVVDEFDTLSYCLQRLHSSMQVQNILCKGTHCRNTHRNGHHKEIKRHFPIEVVSSVWGLG